MREKYTEVPRRERSIVLGLVIFALFAGACAFFLTVFGLTGLYSAPGAILLVSAGLMAVVYVLWTRLIDTDGQVVEQGAALEALRADVEVLRRRFSQPHGSVDGSMVEEMRALRQSVKELVGHVVEKADTGRAPESMRETFSASNEEHLVLLLEPVIELELAVPVHYRARVNLASAAGAEVPHDDLADKADEGGMRAALDLHVLGLVLPVLARLLVKHPDMLILVPMGAAMLASKPDFDHLLRMMDDHGEIARAVVLEFSHTALFELDAGGKKGLARLGQRGAALALSDVSIADLDLASLRKSGFRYLCIDPADAAQGRGPASSLAEFAQFAAAMQFQIICGPIRTKIQASLAVRHARFGYGPYLAPPRRVRGEENQPGQSRTWAA